MSNPPRILSDLSATSSRPVTPDDEALHAPDPTDAMRGETSWWVFTDPTTATAGWVYLLVRPNLGVGSLGVWVWNGTTALPWELPYSKVMVHIPLRSDLDLRHVVLPDHGLKLHVTEPFQAMALRYEDAGIVLDLALRATGPPHPMGIGATTGHVDQPLHARGALRVAGTDIAVDGPAFRDRTWSSRPETAPGVANCYSWAASEEFSFQLLAMLDDSGQPTVFGGFLRAAGRSERLTVIAREVLERHRGGWPVRIRVTGTDSAGRDLVAEGTVVSAAAISAFAGYLTWATLVRWMVDGREVWGEDHDSWPHAVWRSRVATPSGAAIL